MRLLLPSLLTAALLATAPAARAADYADPLDEFHARVDPSGFIACTTYPVEAWDRTDCEGLSPELEASLRAKLPTGVVLLGAGVFRETDWGFRVQVTRVLSVVRSTSDADDAQLVERARRDEAARFAGTKGGPSYEAIDARLETVGDVRMVRVAYATDGDPATDVIALSVFGAHAVYELRFIGARGHAKELGAIVDRTRASLRVNPAPRGSRFLSAFGFTLLGGGALTGTIVLVATLFGTRRKRRSSAVDWPALRG